MTTGHELDVISLGDGPSRILVGVDGTRGSLRAGAYAAGLARRGRCSLIALCVNEIPTGVSIVRSWCPWSGRGSRRLPAD